MVAMHINNDNFEKEVVNSKGIVLVDFYAEWCGPCKMVGPIIDELSGTNKDVKFVKVNVDENQETASKYSVFSIPTFLIFKDGKVKSQFVGAQSKENILSEIDKVK